MPRAPRGLKKGVFALSDAGKKVKGRKRYILVDTLDLLLNVVVHPADLQDRDGAPLVLDRRTRRKFPFIERIFADANYRGPKLAAAMAKIGTWTIERVRCNDVPRFEALHKRWIVERTLAWISRCRPLAKDFKRHARKRCVHSPPMIRLMLRRLTSPSS
jgi:transposase